MSELKVFQNFGAIYECPKNSKGERLGPLVGYAGRDEQGRQMVGEVYFNLAQLEKRPEQLGFYFSSMEEQLLRLIQKYCLEGMGGQLVFCGMPMGGLSIGFHLAAVLKQCYIYPEKQVIRVADEVGREKSKLVFSRHDPTEFSHAVIVEDVCNNFSTTQIAIDLLAEAEVKVVAIVCFLNRSLTVDEKFLSKQGDEIPVWSIYRQRIMQWKQDDPQVADDVMAGNVVWKPKKNWKQLMDLLEQVRVSE